MIIAKASAEITPAQTSSFNAYPWRQEIIYLCDRAMDHGSCDERQGIHVYSEHKEELHYKTKAMSNE